VVTDGFLAYILPIEKYLPRSRIKESLDQMDRTGLSSTRTSHESYVLALSNLERYIIQRRDGRTTFIMEADVTELKFPSYAKSAIRNGRSRQQRDTIRCGRTSR